MRPRSPIRVVGVVGLLLALCACGPRTVRCDAHLQPINATRSVGEAQTSAAPPKEPRP